MYKPEMLVMELPYTTDELPIYGKRMLEAIKTMRRVVSNKKEFDMRWFGKKFKENNVCHTTACMAGHIASSAWHNKEGLFLEWDQVWDGLATPVFNNDRDSQALEKYFGITYAETAMLFSIYGARETFSAKDALDSLVHFAIAKGVKVPVNLQTMES